MPESSRLVVLNRAALIAPTFERAHLSPAPIAAVRDQRQVDRPGNKPRGLWWSCGDQWEAWLRSQADTTFGSRRLQSSGWRYVVRLAPNARILRLSSEIELRAFTDEFVGYAEEWEREEGTTDRIRWHDVAAAFDGVEMPAFRNFGYRDRLDWTGGWDVASGCVWRASAVASLEMTREPCMLSPLAATCSTTVRRSIRSP